MSWRSNGSASSTLIEREASSVVYSASVPATISACCLMPASRSSISPTRVDCTKMTPPSRMISTMALKKMMRRVSAEKRRERAGRPTRRNADRRSGWPACSSSALMAARAGAAYASR